MISSSIVRSRRGLSNGSSLELLVGELSTHGNEIIDDDKLRSSIRSKPWDGEPYGKHHICFTLIPCQVTHIPKCHVALRWI
jgi:hypothetical protein